MIGLVLSWQGAFGFARAADGRDYMIGASELAKSGIKAVAPGDRLSFRARDDEGGGRNPRATHVKILGCGQ